MSKKVRNFFSLYGFFLQCLYGFLRKSSGNTAISTWVIAFCIRHVESTPTRKHKYFQEKRHFVHQNLLVYRLSKYLFSISIHLSQCSLHFTHVCAKSSGWRLLKNVCTATRSSVSVSKYLPWSACFGAGNNPKSQIAERQVKSVGGCSISFIFYFLKNSVIIFEGWG